MPGRMHPMWVLLIAAAAVIAGLIGGYELSGPHSGQGSPAPSSGSPILSITAAGTLGTAFAAAAALLVNESPGAASPMAAQQYQGSLAALAQITAAHQSYDVAAAADFRLIPQLLYRTYADWEVLFASNPEVLVYDPSVASFSGINSSNWANKIQSPGVALGVANASTDPNGYNGIFVLELQGLLQNGSLSAVYGHFYQGSPGALASTIAGTAKVEPETQVATLIQQHLVQAYITYQSYAVTHHLSYVTLDPRVNLGEFSPSFLVEYRQASTEIVGPAGALVSVVGAPVAYSATVPLNAPNESLGSLFVHLLLSYQGQALLEQYGFDGLSPGYAYGPGVLPALLQPQTVALPASLAGEISG